VDVRRADRVGAEDRIGRGLDRPEAVVSFLVGGEDAEALEIGIERRRVAVARVVVAAERVGLPHLDLDAAERHAAPVPDRADHLQNLAFGAAGLARHAGEVAGLVHRPRDRVEGTEDLSRRAGGGLRHGFPHGADADDANRGGGLEELSTGGEHVSSPWAETREAGRAGQAQTCCDEE
jgi:hypothetical protein